MAVRKAGMGRGKAGTSKAQAAQSRSLFIEAMAANGGNATQAAIAAGYSPKTAKQQGSRLLTDVDVLKGVRAARERASANARLTADAVMVSLARDLRFDPAKLYNADGSLKSILEMDEDTRLALRSVEITLIRDGKGKVIGRTVKIKFPEKTAAREQAMKHFGLYEKDRDQLGRAIARAIIVPAKRPSGHGST